MSKSFPLRQGRRMAAPVIRAGAAGAGCCSNNIPKRGWGLLGGQQRIPEARGVNHSVVSDRAPMGPQDPRAASSLVPLRGCVSSCTAVHLSVSSCLHPRRLYGNPRLNPALLQSSASAINICTLLCAASPLGENKTGWRRQGRQGPCPHLPS